MTHQEDYKQKSNGLRGNLKAELADANAFVSDESYELLKFFGSYQGYDRDTATTRKKAGLDKEWEFMLRLKMPAGRLTAKQYLALDKFCDSRANGSLRITTRQTFQFHQIIKKNLKPFIAEISRELLSTLGGCGDVVRNITTCPAPIVDGKRDVMTALAYDLARHLAPRTEAYWDIFLDGEKLDYPFNPTDNNLSHWERSQSASSAGAPHNAGEGQGDSSAHPHPKSPAEISTSPIGRGNSEPLYGSSYMPRKFKIGIAEPGDNCIDILTNDLAMLALFEDGELKGYNIALGGGMGMKHNNAKTYPRLATPLAFVKPEDAIRMAEAVVKLQRDYGDRENRQHARLKYVVEEQGIGWTRDALANYFGKALDINKPMHHFAIEDHMGWHAQGDGKWFLGIPIPSGRIVDIEKSGDFSGAIKNSSYASAQYRTGLREVISAYQMPLLLTADQNIILSDIEASEKPAIEQILRKHGIKLTEEITPLARHFHACVSLPTCGKALAESERVEIPLVQELNKLFARHDLQKDEIAIRIAGCPNGCSRPYPAEIGIIGRMPGHYVLWIGGEFNGTRLGEELFDKVPLEQITTALAPILARYAAERREEELFGDYCQRIGVEALKASTVEALGGEYKWAV